MEFSQAQYEAAINRLTSGLNDLSVKIGQIPAAANAAMNQWYIPQAVADAIRWIAEKLVNLLTGMLNTIKDLLKGAIAPIRMFMDSFAWQDIRGVSSGVSGRLKSTALQVDDVWKGTGRDAYVNIVPPQSNAADRIAKIATSTHATLTICAAAGLAFYVALGVIVVKLIAAAIAAIAAFGSAVFSWAGALIILEEAGVNTGLIIAAVGALTALLGAQAAQMGSLHGEAVDASMFPGGRWPDPATGTYNDATVTDGDADWSLRR